MSDLVERLKRNSLRIDHGINELCGSAAARITELETALAEARNAALEEAAKACEAERLSEPQDDSDAAYDSAIDHCVQAIRDMKDRT